MLDDSIRKEIADLVKKGLYQEALETLESIIDEQKDRSIKRAFREVQARYQKIKRDKQVNLITYETLTVEQSRLSAKILDILDFLQATPHSKSEYESPILTRKVRHWLSFAPDLPWRILLLSFLALIVCLLLNYVLQNLALNENESSYSRIVFGIQLFIAILTVLGSIFVYIQYIGKELDSITKKTSKDKKKLKRLEQQHKKNRRAKRWTLLKQNTISIVSTLGIFILILYVTSRCYLSLGEYSKYTNQVESYEVEREQLQGNIRPKPEYTIVLNDIGQIGSMVGKIDLHRDLLSDFNDEIKTYSLPIEVVENLNEEEVDRKARNSKGVYLIEGHYNDYRARLTVTDRTIYKTGSAYTAEKFGLIDSTDFRQYPRQPIEEEFTNDDIREYQISSAIPKQLKYFQMKMIAELMYKELSSTYQDKDIVKRKRLQKFMEGTLRIAEKNLIFQTNWWGFSPRPLPNLDASKLFLLLSNIYRMKANETVNQEKKGSENYIYNGELIQRGNKYHAHAKDCLRRASQFFEKSEATDFDEFLILVQDYQLFTARSFLNIRQAFNMQDKTDATVIIPKLKSSETTGKITLTSGELRHWEASIEQVFTVISNEHSLFKDKHEQLTSMTDSLFGENKGVINKLIHLAVKYLIQSTEETLVKIEKKVPTLRIKKNRIMHEAGLR